MHAHIFFNHPSLLSHIHLVPRAQIEIGCNYFNDIRHMDHICAYDPETARVIATTPHTHYWTRTGHRNDTWSEVTYPLSHAPVDSGTLAVMLAIKLGITSAHIIGCGWLKDNTSLFDTHYAHHGAVRKYTRNRVMLLKRYQLEYGINLTFVDCVLEDTAFTYVDYWAL